MAGAARPILFVADLHLSAARPALARLFERFLEEEAAGADALYILGDLFEYWLGDDDRDDTIAETTLAALRCASDRGLAVRFMAGNRDFLLGSVAARRAGLERIPDPLRIDLFGRPALLAHGDAYCTDDLRYQAYRRRIRNPFVRAGLRALPLPARRGIARSLRSRSEAEKQAKPMAIMDVNQDAVAGAFRESGVDLLIHGHTHRPAHHTLIVDGRRCDRWVLQDWHDDGGFLRATPAGIEAIAFPA